MSRRAGPTDLTDAPWATREPLVPPPPPGGRPPAPARRERTNAMLDVLRGGIAWRAMPHDLSPWQTAFQVLPRR
jgi:transposase